MNGLNAGDLNRLIAIQAHGAGVDALLQPINDWANIANGSAVWASYRSETGMGAIKNAQGGMTSAVIRCSWRVRYRPDVTPGMRVRFGTNNYDIVTVRHDEADRQWTDMVCTFGGNDG